MTPRRGRQRRIARREVADDPRVVAVDVDLRVHRREVEADRAVVVLPRHHAHVALRAVAVVRLIPVGRQRNRVARPDAEPDAEVRPEVVPRCRVVVVGAIRDTVVGTHVRGSSAADRSSSRPARRARSSRRTRRSTPEDAAPRETRCSSPTRCRSSDRWQTRERRCCSPVSRTRGTRSRGRLGFLRRSRPRGCRQARSCPAHCAGTGGQSRTPVAAPDHAERRTRLTECVTTRTSGPVRRPEGAPGSSPAARYRNCVPIPATPGACRRTREPRRTRHRMPETAHRRVGGRLASCRTWVRDLVNRVQATAGRHGPPHPGLPRHPDGHLPRAPAQRLTRRRR